MIGDAQAELTEREQHILEYVWRGYSTSMIAAALATSPRTIEAQGESLLRKFGATNAIQLVRAALRRGLLEI